MARTNTLAQKTWVEHNIKGKKFFEVGIVSRSEWREQRFKKSFTKTKIERKFNVESYGM